MAKALDSPCLFCGGLPCVCDGGPKKKSSPRTRKASSRTEPTTTAKSPSSTPSDNDLEDAFGATPKQTRSRFKSASHSDRDLSLESAIRVLLDSKILHSSSEREAQKILSRHYPRDVDRRIAEWKEGHVR